AERCRTSSRKSRFLLCLEHEASNALSPPHADDRDYGRVRVSGVGWLLLPDGRLSPRAIIATHFTICQTGGLDARTGRKQNLRPIQTLAEGSGADRKSRVCTRGRVGTTLCLRSSS